MEESKTPEPTRPATHILATASTMLGVTTTLIGLVKLLETQTHAMPVDELAGGVVILFLGAAVGSYASIRIETKPRLEPPTGALGRLGVHHRPCCPRGAVDGLCLGTRLTPRVGRTSIRRRGRRTSRRR